MKIGIDTDKNTLVYDSFFRNPISVIEINNFNSGTVDISFTDMPVALGSRMVEIGIKPHGEYNYANFLAYANSYVLNGQYFRMSPSLNTVAIQNYFALSANIPEVLLSVQARWSDNSGINWSYSNVVDLDVNNSLFQGGELSSFAISSFLSQIVPILQSYTWPINLFNTGLNLTNSNLTIAGSATGISMTGGNNYLNVAGSILTTNLSSNVINSSVGNIQTLSSNQVNTTSLNAAAATIGTLNITQLEVGGFTATGNLSVQGTVAGNLITTTSTPATSATAGITGSISYDNNFLYVRTVSAWKRVALNLF